MRPSVAAGLPRSRTTLNHKLKTVFPSTGATNPFAFTDVLWSGFFRVSEPKTDFDEQHLSRNFSGCDLSEQNGTVCGQEFFRELVVNSICVERPLRAPAPPPLPPARKKTTAPLPPVKTRGVSPKRWSFRGTSVVSFMKTQGSFSPARLKLI